MARVVYVDAADCTVSASPASIANDGVATSTITVRCLDDRGEPMQGLAAAQVAVTSTGTGNTIVAFDSATNRLGDIRFTMTSTVSATKTISATVCGRAVTDTATVTVGSADAFVPNLPTGVGLVNVFDSTFANTAAEGDYNSEGFAYYWDGEYITGVTGAPHASTAFETRYAGNDAGNGVGGAKLQTPETSSWTKMCFALAMWVPSNYVIHSNTEKFFYPLTLQGGVVSAFPINWAPGWQPGSGPSASTFGFGYAPSPGAGFEFQTGTARVTKGQWATVEFFMQMNTPNTSDGVLKIWVDGAVAENKTDMRYFNGAAQAVWRAMRFDGTRGGGASTVLTPPGGQVRRYNRLAFYASDT